MREAEWLQPLPDSLCGCAVFTTERQARDTTVGSTTKLSEILQSAPHPVLVNEVLSLSRHLPSIRRASRKG